MVYFIANLFLAFAITKIADIIIDWLSRPIVANYDMPAEVRIKKVSWLIAIVYISLGVVYLAILCFVSMPSSVAS